MPSDSELGRFSCQLAVEREKAPERMHKKGPAFKERSKTPLMTKPGAPSCQGKQLRSLTSAVSLALRHSKT
eukprot:3694385-Amphidinium_carterae.2